MIGQLNAMFQNGAAAAANASLLYAAATATAALFALTARRPARRRDARKVLALLLHRSTDEAGEPTEKP